jgi:hypothetical protein
MAAPGAGSLIPPLSLSMGSSATAGPTQGGSAGGAGMGALNQGDWIIQRTGTGNNSAVPTSSSSWVMLAIGAGVAWFLARR